MNSIKYYVKGTIRGSRQFDDYEDTMLPIELLEYIDEIKAMFKRDEYDELAQYIHEGDAIYGVVTEIWVSVKVIDGTLYSWTEVTANRELTEFEKEALLDYLSGQFSDGYGEGLEQEEFTSYTDTETYEEYDEENDEYYEDEYTVRVSCHIHLWNREEFKLEFVEATEIQEEETPSVTKPKCKLIGEDGNIFNLIGIASRTLRYAGLEEKAKEMGTKVLRSSSYSEALSIISEYVEVM